MLDVDINVWSKVCEIFEVNSNSSLFTSTDDEEYDSDRTFCEEAEVILASQKSSFSPSEDCASQNILPEASLAPCGDIQDESAGFQQLWGRMIRYNEKPTVDEFVPCFKNFKRNTLIRLKLQLEQYLMDSEQVARQHQEALEWYNHFKVSDEEKEDALRCLSEISDNHNK